MAVLKKTPNLYDFDDYRTYLLSYCKAKKKQSGWSLTVWAKQLGLKSPSSLTMVLNQKRSLSKSLQNKLIRQMKFTHHEAEYFSDLVRLSKYKEDSRLKSLLKRDLKKVKLVERPRLITDEECSEVSNWYTLAVREMTHLKDFCDDPAWITEKLAFPATQAQIRTALATLVKLGLVSVAQDGSVKATYHITDTPQGNKSIAILHEKQLNHAIESLELSSSIREITGTTLPIRLEKLPEIKDLIRRFKSELLQLFDEPQDGDAVYQLMVSFFPLTVIANE